MKSNASAAEQVAARIVAAGQVPGMVVALVRADGPVEHVVVGTDGVGAPLVADSLFPVASVTKLATALVVLRLCDAGTLALDDVLGEYVPDAYAAQPGVTLRTLLCHASGLPIDVASEDAPYKPGLDWPKLAHACRVTELEAPPLTRVQYSNVGYGLLASVVEAVTGEPFAAMLRALVLEPLRIEAYFGTDLPRPHAVIANVRGAAGTPQETFNSPFWRGLAMPWAGLVTTAAGALTLVRAFAGVPADFLSPAMRAEATRNQTGDLAGGFVPPLRWNPALWGLGPELRGHKEPHWAPPSASPESFGHSGASGCVAWCDPKAQVAWALLGSRAADSGWLLRRGREVAAAVLG